LSDGREHDFRWQPGPAILRRLALVEAAKLKGRSIALRHIADATPEVEYTEAHKSAMAEKFAGLLARLIGSEGARYPGNAGQ
jgi:hypothetical protein